MSEINSTALPARVKDLSGQRFGRLLVVRYAGLDKYGRARWLCCCDCGGEHTAQGGNLRTAHTKSCGCLSPDINRRQFVTHGKHGTVEYRAWSHMIQRCFNPNNKRYANYGGRGISVCERWRCSFANFLTDMGRKPSPQHSLDRIDNDGNYEKSNCRWTLAKQQNQNRSNNRLLTFDGETKVLADWAEAYGIQRTTLRDRLNAGWSIERALTEPIHRSTPI